MTIKNLNYDDFKSNCYLVEIDDKKYLIDASIDLNIIKKMTDKLDGILITHGHIDHIMNLKELYDYYKCNVYLHKNAIDKVENNDHNCAKIFGFNKNLKIDNYCIVHEGDKIDNLIKVLETPGHTNCSIVFIIEDVMFSGDTLFRGSVGRTDLYSGSSIDLIRSIKRISELNGDYKVYPGHEDSTLLSIERKCNPYMRK